MEHEKILLTKEGIERLEKERELLINVERTRVIEELQAARAQGDLSENADYDAARDRQAVVEARIKEIERMLANIVLIEETGSTSVVEPGTTVTFVDLSDKEELVYAIVGSFETNPSKGKISNESPLGKAMMGKAVGDTVTVMVEEPYDIKIKKIERL